MEKKVLVVDDENNIRFVLTRLLSQEGYISEAAKDGLEALSMIEKFHPDIILLDLEMPEMGGIATLKQFMSRSFTGKTIIITAYGSIPSAVEAMRLGAFDYVTKPFNNEEILIVIEKAIQHDKLEKELVVARSRLETQFSVKGIITNNPKMKQLLETVTRVSATDNPILIIGESGTGKELFANAIHQHSLRKDCPFVALNCAAIPENLVESELFGFRKGSFSGANNSKIGLVEEADKGTLFLDEIGEMGVGAQVKLLRFTETGEFLSIGATSPKRVNVRVVAASNRDLEAAIAEGKFRADLFYRLNVIKLMIPPLRNRKEDIPLLVEHFIRKHKSSDFDRPVKFSPKAMKELQYHSWPGNIRELENTVRYSLATNDDSVIGHESLPVLNAREISQDLDISTESNLKKIVAIHQAVIEKEVIMRTVRECDFNKSKAAVKLGICRNTLMKKMKEYGLE